MSFLPLPFVKSRPGRFKEGGYSCEVWKKTSGKSSHHNLNTATVLTLSSPLTTVPCPKVPPIRFFSRDSNEILKVVNLRRLKCFSSLFCTHLGYRLLRKTSSCFLTIRHCDRPARNSSCNWPNSSLDLLEQSAYSF